MLETGFRVLIRNFRRAGWLPIFLLLAALAEAVPLPFTYTTSNGKVTVTEYVGTDKTVVIPDMLGGFPVTCIGAGAFSDSPVTNVTISAGVTNIGIYAFEWSALVKVTLPDSLEYIAFGAFSSTALKTVSLPGKLKVVEVESFSSCTNLVSVTLAEGIATINPHAFRNCPRLASVKLPVSVTSIGENAFSSCALTSFTFPNGVTGIGPNVFYECASLTNVVLNKAVISIGENAFDKCDKLQSFSADAQNPAFSCSGGVLFNKGMTELLRFPGGKKGTVKIPSGVRKIAPYAFYSCVAVSSIDVPSTVTNIGDYAFSYSTNLLSVSVTDNVAFFGTALFSGCTRLASFTLPKSITTIKDSMFSYCESLTGVTIPGSVTTIQDYAFLECESLTSMVIPASVRHVGDWAFLGCSDLTALRFLGSAPTVGDEPFETGVTKIYYLAWAPGWGAFLGGCPAVMMPAIEIVQEMNPVTVAEGGTGVLRIKLASQPLGELTVTTARLGGDVNITVSAGGSLVFSPSTWNTFKTVTLAASEDDGDNENGQASFTCSGIGLTTAFVHANEVDDDCSLLVTSPYGEATVSPSRLFYEMGTEVTVSVEPDRSMHFTEWSGDYAGTANPVALTLTGDTRITANFSPNLPAPLPPRAAGKKSFVARWKWADDAAPEGELSVASDSAFTRLVPGYEARYVVNETDCSVTGLVEGKDYWYRVRRYLQDDSLSAWSPKMKVRTGTAMPAFRHLLSEVPVSKGVTQQFPLASLASGTGALAARSSNTDALQPLVSPGGLLLQYRWKNGIGSALVTMSLTHPAGIYSVSYLTRVTQATGSVAIVQLGALTNTATGAAQEVVLENRTGKRIYGVRLRAKGLDQAAWLLNQTGLEPNGVAPIIELPCVLAPGDRLTVQLLYHNAYKRQARTREAGYKAWAVMPPLTGSPQDKGALNVARLEAYQGARMVGLQVDRNRLYSFQYSDDGTTWVPCVPSLRATSNYLSWMDLDDDAPVFRQYRVLDAGL